MGMWYIAELCGVTPGSQKLIFKGKEHKDADSLAAAGVSTGDKLMLMLSAEGVSILYNIICFVYLCKTM